MVRICKVLCLCLLAVVVSCGGPPKPKDSLVYLGLSENLPRLDPTILSGRRIVIDPGHGGYFRGTLGQEGLAESRVNLGVSLYLWGLLREAGAEVVLTRSAERDFLTETDSTLASELAVRVAIVDSLQPDILVSIHHNAQSERDPSKNATETYYRFGDPSSRDLAFAVHRHLMRNLGIEEGEVRPGNYYILRNVDVPAILGEGSYLTHPPVESNLRLSDKQRLEAEAYFLGILEYFSRGTPRVAQTSPVDSVLEDVPTLSFSLNDVGGLGVDPGGIDLRVNGRAVVPFLPSGGRELVYRFPWDSPNGVYRISLEVRNLLGNASPVHRSQYQVALPAQSVAFEVNPTALPQSGGTARIRARLLDRRGIPIADGSTVAIRSSIGTTPAAAVVERGAIEFPLTVPASTGSVTVTLSSGDNDFEVTLATSDAPGALRKFAITDSTTGQRIHQATVLHGDSLIANGSKSGIYFFPTDVAGDTTVWILAAGYKPIESPISHYRDAQWDTLALAPWYEGKLIGKRFMLDPEGGFGPEPGLGQLGLSGPHVNLQVARYLKEYLETAGANVALTRTTEETLSPRDVVAATNRLRADRYIEIRHRDTVADTLDIACYFFPGSRTGSRMAGQVQEALATALGLAVQPAEDQVTFPLQQTACPAIVVEAPSIGIMDEELRLGDPWYQRKQAYGIFQGILSHYGVEGGHTLNVRVTSDSNPSNWLVTLDRSWSLLTPPSGEVSFSPLAPGAYTLELRRGTTYRRESIRVEPSSVQEIIREFRVP